MNYLKRLSVVGLAVVLTSAALASPAQAKTADTSSMFGEIFSTLPALDTQTSQELADLAQLQLDPNADADNNPTGLLSGFTYFGQFVDHDLTRDTSPSPTAFVDPTTLPNQRTFKFDLDSVYGGGPTVSPQLYEADKKHFKVQNPSPNGVVDLPRNPDGSAILVEPRNDENQIISQIHTAFLLFHNKQVDKGYTFYKAQSKTIATYQVIVFTEFLPHIVGTDTIIKLMLAKKKDRFYEPGSKKFPMTPVEFSVAAYRFGHSQVRRAYRLNGTNNCGNLQVFSLTDPTASLMGGRPLQAGRQIAWGQFLPQLAQPAECAALVVTPPASSRNVSRKIDSLLSSSLFQLPIPGAEAAGSNVLGFRNLIRAKFYGMPSGQSVAAAMGVPVITPEQLNLGPAFANGTPLWYYILAEASMTQNGERLGAVGANLVADCFLRVLQIDKDSILNKPVIPAGTTLADVVVTAGLATRP